MFTEEQSLVVELLLQNGAKVNQTTKDKRSALYIAAQKGNTDIARILLRHDADPNLRTKHGTAMDRAQPHAQMRIDQ